jgi:hypothetical protein
MLSAANKRRDRRRLLKRLGYSLDTPASIDCLDATLCAHAAACFAEDKFEQFGNAKEGFIVLPPWRALPR